MWYPSTIGFVRNTLGARRCDVVIGKTIVNELMQKMKPYCRSTYALIQRVSAELLIKNLDDPALKEMPIGGVANTLPITLLAQKGGGGNLEPYQLMADTRHDYPAHDMVKDVETGAIDIAVVWGPIGGYYAKQAGGEVIVTPIQADEKSPMRMGFRISMGLRRGEPIWKDQLNNLLRSEKDATEAILHDYGVPPLDNRGNSILPKEQEQGSLVPEPDGYRMAEFRAPVPATLKGADVLGTGALKALVENESPLPIDVMPAPRMPRDTGLWISPKRDNLSGSHWLADTGYGKLSADFAAFFEQELARLTAGDASRKLVFYCETDCWMSWNAAKRALSLGYEHVAWYPDGSDGRKAANLPLESAGALPMPDFLPLTDGSNRTASLQRLAHLSAN